MITPKWIIDEEVCKILGIKLETLRKRCRNGEFTYQVKKINNKNIYFINEEDIPETKSTFIGDSYGDAPAWATIQADKYIVIIKECNGLKGKKLKIFIDNWNKENPDCHTSYANLMKMRARYKKEGINGLLARYGNSNTQIYIEDKYFDYFKALFLVEGSPSLVSCWEQTLGYAIRTDGIDKADFPSHMAFKRRVEKEISKQGIYLARNGQSAWNRKYGSYINRDYSNIKCGQVWVSDHAQIDVACMRKDGTVVFPWVTAWRDYKSGKWLGWVLQTDHPNSDHIFQAFYIAANEYGLPDDVIIDNGKDYRAKDFAGGRKIIKVDGINKGKTTSMLSEINVEAHFALPYNAQTKPIERDFLKIKELLSKHCVGYRGGNIVERPEKLIQEIKKERIVAFDRFKCLFDKFIIDILNKKPSQGKNHKGLSPNELFNKDFTEKRVVSKNALKLFCMRTSKNFTIGRNGIKDNELSITYWADWMITQTGLKVYLRRDINNYKEAWAFKTDNDEFVGKVFAIKAVAALHANEISKEEFKEAMEIKKRNLKVTKAYIQQTQEISPEEQYENYKAVYAKVIQEANPKITKIANTNMDKAVRKNKKMEVTQKQDYSQLLDNDNLQEERLYLFETDKILDEETKGVASGY